MKDVVRDADKGRNRAWGNSASAEVCHPRLHTPVNYRPFGIHPLSSLAFNYRSTSGRFAHLSLTYLPAHLRIPHSEARQIEPLVIGNCLSSWSPTLSSTTQLLRTGCASSRLPVRLVSLSTKIPSLPRPPGSVLDNQTTMPNAHPPPPPDFRLS